MRFRPGLAVLALASLALVSCGHRSAPAPAWTAIPLGTDAEIEDVWFADSLHGWIVGGGPFAHGGLVGRTLDGGATWRYTSGIVPAEENAVRFSIATVRFLDFDHGFLGTQGGRIFATDDGGENWRLVREGRGGFDHVLDLDFTDRWNGWAIGTGGLLQTSDGGETWTTLEIAHPERERVSGRAIRFVGESEGWVAASEGRLLHTKNGGYSWEEPWMPLPAEDRPRLHDLCFVDEAHGWVVGEQGVILRTTDGGATWTLLDTGLADTKSRAKPEIIERRRGVVDTLDLGEITPGLSLTGVGFADERRGWVAGHFGYEGRSVVLRTDDGGDHWTLESDVEGEEWRALFVLDRDRAWAAGTRDRDRPHVIVRRNPAAAAAAAEPAPGVKISS